MMKRAGPGPADTYRVCYALPIEGDPPIVVVDDGPGVDEGVVPPLARDYELQWMKVDPDPMKSFIHLLRKSDSKTVWFRVGDKVGGAWKLLEITNRSATFENVKDEEGQQVTLEHKLVSISGGVGPAEPAAEPGEIPRTLRIGGEPEDDSPPPIDAPAREAVMVRENLWSVPKEEREWFRVYGEKVIEDIAVIPEKDPDTGKPNGVRIKTIRKGSILAKRGLKPGDKVISINGKPVTSRQDAISYVKGEGKGATRYIVEIERRGTIIKMTYNVKDR